MADDPAWTRVEQASTIDTEISDSPPFAPGEMARAIRERDWSDSPIGAPADWPQSLKTAVGLLLPAAAQIVLFWGPEYVAIYNDAYAPTIGNKHPQALGRPARENWAELWDDLEPLLRSVRETGQTVFAKDRPFYIERHGYPETVNFDISYSAVPDEHGDVGGVLCIVAETTERVVAEHNLRARERRLSDLFENAGVGMIEIDADWNILASNNTYRQITERSEEDLRGANCLSFTHVDDIEVGSAALRRLAAGEIDRISFEKRYLTPGGGTIWVRSNLARISADEKENRFLKIVEDITSIRLAQDALREERQTLEILHRIGSALAGELDLDRVVQMVTDAGVELTGAQFGAFFYNVVDEAGESYTLYTLSGADRSHFEKFGMPRNTQVFGPTFLGEGIVRSDDITKDPRYGHNPPHHGMPKGHLPVVSYLALPVKGRSGEVIGGLFFGHPHAARFKERHEHLMEAIAGQAAIAMDNARLFRAAQHEIDQRMRAEEALKALNETLETRVGEEIERRADAEGALRQTQKMETIGQLSGGIAHDFNNLLQIIHGNLTILQRSLPADQKKWQRSLANALTGTDRAAALTQRLLAFSRRQPLNPRALDVNEMIEEMIELLHRTLGETIRIETSLAPSLPNAQVDGNQLENALLNLAINARDAMAGGGSLQIETGVTQVDGGHPSFGDELQPGCYVRIAVRDTGTGMSADVLSRAIEPFFSTKEVGQGTGLGLSMVYGFAKQSGGHFSLSSVEGEGTTAELLLPCASQTAEERPSRAREDELPGADGEHVLVCEDDPDVRQFSSEALRELGYEVTEAVDAGSALAALERGPVDLLFTDVVLPGGTTGADLAEAARRLQPELKVLFTTGYARSALPDQKSDTAGIELLAKPYGIDDLAIRLRKLLD